ncbi:MAG: GldG family protein [Armatimonadetes bacterium]|nr:GldG family protein [Armatimonadota bacterium]MDW8121875.1 GldG family protein [Armatimonadota bacterium]
MGNRLRGLPITKTLRRLIHENALPILMTIAVLSIGALTLRLAYPATPLYWGSVLGVAGLLLLALIAVEFRELLTFLISQKGQMGTSVLVSTLLLIGILVLIVYVADRREISWDWTKIKRHSLSPQTINVLKNLKKEVKVYAFYDAQSPEFPRVQDLLRRYRSHSAKISFQVVDPDREPLLAREKEVTGSGITIFEANGKKERVSFGGEKEFTGAIIKVTSDKKPNVYFLVGHGEKSPEDFGATGISNLKTGLERQNYIIKTLKLMTEGKIPADCDVLVIAGAQQSLLPQEKKVIDEYLKKGGKLLLMLEPDPAPSFSDWLDQWGLQTNPGIVVEPENNIIADAAAVFALSFRFHDITRPFQKAQQEAVLFVTARPLKRKSQVPSGVTVSELIESSANSWREGELKGAVRKDQGEEGGPFILACAVEKTISDKKKQRTVVIADSDFFTNGLIANLRNGAFAASCIHWLAGEDVLIEIPPKEDLPSRMFLSRHQQVFTVVWSLIALPLAILMTGFIVWWNRRG